MSDATFLFLVSALYLFFGAWVITRTGGSRRGAPVKVARSRDDRDELKDRF